MTEYLKYNNCPKRTKHKLYQPVLSHIKASREVPLITVLMQQQYQLLQILLLLLGVVVLLDRQVKIL